MSKLFQWLKKISKRQSKEGEQKNLIVHEKPILLLQSPIVHEEPNVTWEHLWPEDQARTAVENSPFGQLPNELIVHIFKYLNINDLSSVSSVCRLFKMNADRDEIWKTKVHGKFIYLIICFYQLTFIIEIAPMEVNSKPYKQVHMDLKYTLERFQRLKELALHMEKTPVGIARIKRDLSDSGCFPSDGSRSRYRNIRLM